MRDISNWLNEQSLADLARFAGRPPSELSQVIVTEAMKNAAMEYIYSLYDPLISTHILEEVFRIMAVLQPKVPGHLASLCESSQTSRLQRPESEGQLLSGQYP
ncbi:hypothetical protein [Pseudomonas tremae]|uniref:hypothetical protein n=1 Tax=Pseudomonas tremae TaxID=200454 RepID=UPI001183B1AE|nr:hypothetical protein [Pseudomonas tremae]